MRLVVMIPVTLLDHTSTVALLLTCMPASTAALLYCQAALCTCTRNRMSLTTTLSPTACMLTPLLFLLAQLAPEGTLAPLHAS